MYIKLISNFRTFDLYKLYAATSTYKKLYSFLVDKIVNGNEDGVATVYIGSLAFHYMDRDEIEKANAVLFECQYTVREVTDSLQYMVDENYHLDSSPYNLNRARGELTRCETAVERVGARLSTIRQTFVRLERGSASSFMKLDVLDQTSDLLYNTRQLLANVVTHFPEVDGLGDIVFSLD